MAMRRCPQCRSTTDDKFGFCIKCGYEFPKQNTTENKICAKCGQENPKEATHCVNCGFPLNIEDLFKGSKLVVNSTKNDQYAGTTSHFIIILGYILTILGSILGLIVAIYLVTRKDPIARKHGSIQIAVLILEFAIIIALISFGIIDLNTILNKTNTTIQNITNLK